MLDGKVYESSEFRPMQPAKGERSCVEANFGVPGWRRIGAIWLGVVTASLMRRSDETQPGGANPPLSVYRSVEPVFTKRTLVDS